MADADAVAPITGAAAGASLDQELLQLMARGAQRSPLSVCFAALVLAATAYGKAPGWAVACWLVAVTAVVIVRRAWIARLAADAGRPAAAKLPLVAALAALTGGSFGASMLFWPYFGDLERAVASMVILGLCAGSVATTLGYRPIFLAFFGAAAGPLCVAWLVSAATSPQRAIEVSIAVLIALFGYILTMLARDSFRLFADAFDGRRRQAELNDQLRGALAEAEAANRAKTRFLASASHDLRQPLHTVSLFGAALSMRPLDERTRQIADLMNVALQSLGSQLDALLDLSKLDAGVVAVRLSTFDLGGFVASIGAQFRPQATTRGLQLIVESEPGLACRTDELLLGRIVANLVDNAIKYTPVGVVAIRAARVGTAIRLSVSDSGIGIARAERDKVFEEFYQVDNPERDRTRGLGLGLSIVARTAELLHLPLQLQSMVPGGSVFTLDLPAASGSAPAPPPGADEEIGLAGLQVLVIDDEEGVRDGMQALLEGWGCRVATAADTAAALDAARRCAPDLALVDFRLRAGDDGIATIAAIRTLHPATPALLISGDTAPARLREAHAAQLRLLHKPVQAAALRRAIRDELNASAGADRGPGAARPIGSDA